MSEASYDRQHLAIHAAGFINAAGSTSATFGCQMTRVGEGQYAMILGANDGLVDDEGFIEVTCKGANPAAAVVTDTSNTVKTIDVREGGSDADRDIEVILFKTVTR